MAKTRNERPSPSGSITEDEAHKFLDQVINTDRDFHRAWQYAVRWSKTAWPTSAHMWFKRALTASLIGNTSDRDHAVKIARRCPNFTPQMEGDLLCDEALMYIRAGKKLLWVDDLLYKAKQIFASDPNREAKVLMIKGRYLAAQGAYESAVTNHLMAHRQWVNLQRAGQPVDEQWMVNNAFAGLRPAVMRGRKARRAWELFLAHVLEHEPNEARKEQARKMDTFGRPAVWLVRQREKWQYRKVA
jgi:hypothetical protein